MVGLKNRGELASGSLMSPRRAICVHFKNGHWPWKYQKSPVSVTQGQSEKHAFPFTFSFDFSPPYAQELYSHGQDRLLSKRATRVDKAGANHTNLSWHDAIILCFAFWTFALKRQNSPLPSTVLSYISSRVTVMKIVHINKRWNSPREPSQKVKWSHEKAPSGFSLFVRANTPDKGH